MLLSIFGLYLKLFVETESQVTARESRGRSLFVCLRPLFCSRLCTILGLARGVSVSARSSIFGGSKGGARQSRGRGDRTSAKIDKVWDINVDFWFGGRGMRQRQHSLLDPGLLDAGALGKEPAAMDGPVLSYGPVVLRHPDMDLLQGPHYLNDQIIEFFFYHLTLQHRPAEGAPDSGPLLLVGPSLTFWLLHCPDADGLQASIQPLNLPDRQVILFALNNNEDVETAEGGTHWTLLVYTRQRNTFEHFDSMSGTNWRQARALVNIIKPFIGPAAASAKLTEPVTPQQENSYDCGVYVMAIAKVICQAFQDKRTGFREPDIPALLRSQVTADNVTEMRQHTLDLISSLRLQQQQQQQG